MKSEKDYSQIVNRLDDERRAAILIMGENMDTCEGFEIPYRVMKLLISQELVNVDDQDEHAKNPIYWLNRNGLACSEIIRQQNIDRKRIHG